VFQAGGGSGGGPSNGGAGGTISGSGTPNYSFAGGPGCGANNATAYAAGGIGGTNHLGGAGGGGPAGTSAGTNASPNTGAGGGGGGSINSGSVNAGGGGGAGAYIRTIIANPLASYTYAIGAGGGGGAAGASSGAGGNGAAGIIVVTENYSNLGPQGPVGPQGTPGPTTPADAFVATLSADQTGIAASTWTKVNFNVAGYNQNGKFSTSTSRWTPAAGPVQIEAQLNNTVPGSSAYVGIYKNGVLLKNNAVPNAYPVSISVVDVANGTDYYECWYNSAVANGVGSASSGTFFQGFAIAPQGPAGLTGPQGPQGIPGPTTPADAFVATLSADQTGIAASTWTKINFNTAGYNQNGKFFTTGANAGRWIPSAGPVQIEAQVSFSTQVTGEYYASIYKNGASFKLMNCTSGNYVNISVVDTASGTDYYEVWCFNSSANTVSSPVANTFFQGFAIAPQGPAGLAGPAGPAGPAGLGANPADAFIAALGVDQSVSGTASKLNFNSVLYNQNGKYSAANQRWTPSAGPVQIEIQAFLNAGTVGTLVVALYKNGASFKQLNIVNNFALMSVVDTANGTDYYEAWIVAAGGTGPFTISSASTYTFFQGFAIAPQGPAGATGPQGPQGTPGPTTPADAFASTLSADQTGIAANTNTKINFNTAGFNQNGKFSTSTSRWTPAAGPVQIEGQLAFSAGTRVLVEIYKNGALLKGKTSNLGVPCISVVDNANGTDYYECWALGDTACSITSGAQTFFQGFAISPQGPAGPQGPQGTPGPTTPADAFIATLSADQTGLAANTNIKINFNTASFNQNGKFNTSNSRWTPAAGPVQIEAQLLFSAVATNVYVSIYKNGVQLKFQGTAQDSYVAISVVDTANGTDYYECWGQTTTAGSVSSLVATTFFQGFAIAPQGPAGPQGSMAVLPKYLSGLTLSNDTTSPTIVLDIDAGSCCSDDNTTMMVRTTAITKNCNAAWAVGIGNGALDAGSALVVNTWYHVFQIERIDTGIVDVLISTSSTAPIMPANYTKKRRIGSIWSDGSAHILPFIQTGGYFLKTGAPNWDVTSFTTGTVDNWLTLSVPSGVRVLAVVRAYVSPGGSVNYDIHSGVSAGNYSIPNLSVNVAPYTTSGQFELLTNTASQIGVMSSTNAANFFCGAIGWVDYRGT
jgi:hypothetical protein